MCAMSDAISLTMVMAHFVAALDAKELLNTASNALWVLMIPFSCQPDGLSNGHLKVRGFGQLKVRTRWGSSGLVLGRTCGLHKVRLRSHSRLEPKEAGLGLRAPRLLGYNNWAG